MNLRVNLIHMVCVNSLAEKAKELLERNTAIRRILLQSRTAIEITKYHLPLLVKPSLWEYLAGLSSKACPAHPVKVQLALLISSLWWLSLPNDGAVLRSNERGQVCSVRS